MPWTPLPLPDLADAPPSIRPYLEDLATTYQHLCDFPGVKGRNLGRPGAAEASDLITAAAQVVRQFDREGATILTDLARQLRRTTTAGAAYDLFIDATATLAGIIRAAALRPR